MVKIYDVERILTEIKLVIPMNNNVSSVLLRGSAALGNYIPGKSDIDLTVILEKYDFSDIIQISKSLKELSKRVRVKIGVTYTDKIELELDSKSGMHYHGSINSNYARELAENSIVLLGENIKDKFLAFNRVDISSIYFDASKKLTTFIKNYTDNPLLAYKKGINYSFILSKQILYINKIHEVNKIAIVKKITNLNSDMGILLKSFYQDSKNWLSISINNTKLENMFNYLLFCKRYVGEKLSNDYKK